ncbi:MAG: hypothetical protein ACTSPI_10790 [Candidatus Heimdallarchaeaceae archaeon]
MADEEQNTPISEAQRTPQEAAQSTTQTPEVLKQKSWLIIGLAVLVLLLLGTTGFFAYQNYQLKQQAQQKPPTPLPEVTKKPEIPSPTPDMTSSWQTYSNKLFSIKVPTTMEYDSRHSTNNSMHLLEKNTTGTTMRNAMDITIGFWQNPKGYTKCESDESCYQILFKSVSAGSNGKFETTQGNIMGISRKGLLSWAVGNTVAPDTNVVYQFPISKDGNYFEFNFQIGNATLQEARTNFEEIKQILSTFKFLQ